MHLSTASWMAVILTRRVDKCIVDVVFFCDIAKFEEMNE